MIKIKPLSTNDAWRGGRRFNTKEYLAYIQELLCLLPQQTIPDALLELNVTFYISNKRSDLDNFLKPLNDILQKKYDFNDNRIYRIVAQKKLVEKGNEGIDFSITEYKQM